ncbi:hypothetical protein, partial [Shewanella algae]|uniref:hypothetical protein n=1 Tax=Shewanella algae TaxID=38313 RepID=UPI00313BDA07
ATALEPIVNINRLTAAARAASSFAILISLSSKLPTVRGSPDRCPVLDDLGHLWLGPGGSRVSGMQDPGWDRKRAAVWHKGTD